MSEAGSFAVNDATQVVGHSEQYGMQSEVAGQQKNRIESYASSKKEKEPDYIDCGVGDPNPEAEAHSSESKEGSENKTSDGASDATFEEFRGEDGSYFMRIGGISYKLTADGGKEVGSVEKNEGGDIVVKGKDGSLQEVHNRDGKSIEKNADGKFVEYDHGMQTDRQLKSVATNKDGDVTITDEDGKKEVRRGDGAVLNYDQNRKLTSVRFKDGSGAEKQNGKWVHYLAEGIEAPGEVRDVQVLANGDVVIVGSGKSKEVHHADGSQKNYDGEGNWDLGLGHSLPPGS